MRRDPIEREAQREHPRLPRSGGATEPVDADLDGHPPTGAAAGLDRVGGEPDLDLEKAAMIFLTDYRSGKLGRISLETPASRAAMLAASASQANA